MNDSRKCPRVRSGLIAWIQLSVLLLAGCASTNLMKAVTSNDPALAQKLVASGEDVNQSSANGWTPLLTAARNGYLEMVTFLAENGADIQARNDEGWSALLIASRYGFPPVVDYLLRKGAYVHTRNYYDYTALIVASLGGHLEIVKMLAATDIRLDMKNKAGKTALYYAAVSKREDIAKYLLQRGAQAEKFEAGGEDHYATAVIHKIRGALDAEGQDLQTAVENYRTAADYFEKAGPELQQLAERYVKERKQQQTAAVLSSIFGVVAATVDIANIRQGNPTNFSSLVPPADTANLDAYQIMEKIARAMSTDCQKECAQCRQEAAELGKKIRGLGEEFR